MLGAALRRIRRAQGRTLADVAVAARISMPYLSEIERGRKEASSEVLAAVCDALGVELADLLAAVVHDLTRVDAARVEGARAAGATVRPMPVRRAAAPPASGAGGAAVSVLSLAA
ncbi:helix-turn-helix transcriptional regulator [Actinomadura latina]|uniref:Helix-turn-helix transcriptional regulator n=1 Tax=Actinomadura latina TaxID=163603 RepID=A0A846ZB90_9ACTN|nr:helix-turn-helix transcriptional regulator [Actinomadura latina]